MQRISEGNIRMLLNCVGNKSNCNALVEALRKDDRVHPRNVKTSYVTVKDYVEDQE